MGFKKLLMALMVVGFIAIAALEGKKTRAVQERARRILYPGDPQEILGTLTELRAHDDPDSQALARELEDHLKRRDRRTWARAFRRASRTK